jgi:adenylate cyclase
MASAAVREAAGPDFEWRRLDRVAVVGRSEGTDVYELLGERGTVAAAVLRARDLYEEALAAYFARRFDDAAAGFRATDAARPSDKAASVMAQRAEDLSTYPPPPDWTGVYASSSK